MCVPILNVGSPHDTRSHFSAQDYMERGAPGHPDGQKGPRPAGAAPNQVVSVPGARLSPD